jgi:hypothetical protein
MPYAPGRTTGLRKRPAPHRVASGTTFCFSLPTFDLRHSFGLSRWQMPTIFPSRIPQGFSNEAGMSSQLTRFGTSF